MLRFPPARLLRRTARVCSLLGWHSAEFAISILGQRLYGEREFGVIGRFCDRTKISIDIGAADGLYFHVLEKHSAACVGFEPNPISYARLKRRFPRARLEQCALSDRHGKTELRVPLVDNVLYTGFGTIEQANTFTSLGAPPSRTFSVEVAALDSFRFQNVGMVKIDVEGHEWEVIQGAAATIDRSRPNLMIEIEERHKAGNFDRIVSFFQARGYGVFFVRDGWLRPISEFDFATLQNPNGKAGSALYYNNFFFLSNARRYQDLVR